MENQAFHLFAVPSFWSGAASVFDPAGALLEFPFAADENSNGWDVDAEAMSADWAAVGDDLQAVLNQEVARVQEEATASRPKR